VETVQRKTYHTVETVQNKTYHTVETVQRKTYHTVETVQRKTYHTVETVHFILYIVELLKASRDAKTYAYSPYSKFKVGAALLCEDGTIITGIHA
jgi:hypothetical protein